MFTLDVTQDRLGIDVPALTYITGLVHAWVALRALKGYGHPGVNAPEELANEIDDLISKLRADGIYVEEKVCSEEFL